MATTRKTWFLDPDETLNFTFDWTDWLDTGETIASTPTVSISPSGGATAGSVTFLATGQVNVPLTGNTLGIYTVSCKITTSNSQIAERSNRLRVRHR